MREVESSKRRELTASSGPVCSRVGGVVGGRVGSGFDKFMYDRPELDGTWKDPARLPHSWLDQRIARHLHSQKDLALRGIPILGRSSLLPIFVAMCGRFSLP